jgi:phosphoglycerol transferase MdoB-like AlkP superfamily enzyme
MGALGYLVGFVLLFLVLEWRKKTVSRGCQSGPYRVKLLSAIVIYLGFIFVPAMSYDPLVNFFRSIYHYYFPVVGIDVSVPEHYRPTPTPSHAFWTQATPHFQKQPKYVFLILCESLNFSSLGTPSTPFMTQLKDKSVYVEPFYGNSIQTAKGHFASLFSVIPSISGKEYVKYKTLDVDSVASVMKRAGYSTLYFAAHHNKNFDKESAFLLRNGYDEYEVVKPYLKPEDVASKFKWGVEDRVFFKRFFDYFSSYSDRPVFVTLATIANHFPFNSIPVERRLIHKDPKNIRECYANSIRLTDEGLKVFFDELERRGLAEESLVIVTGDHAFPLGEHGNYHLEAGYHEESFRIPFFMVWKGHLMPQKIIVARSQMDMGPTIVDVLKLPHIPTYFQGRSIFSKGVHPLYLIQPYGKHLSILLYPYKYRFYTATQQEFVYDLSKDAMEKHNIVKDIPPKTLLRFREELNRVYLNQEYIERNLLR